MTIKEEVLADSKSFVVQSDEGLHEILFAQEKIKWDIPMFLVGFDAGGTIMQKGLFFEENGLAVGYYDGVQYKIIRRTDVKDDTEGNDGLSGGGEGVDDNPETEVATIEGEQLTSPEIVDEFLAREDAPKEEVIAYLLGYQRGVEYAYEKLRMIVYTDEGKIL